MKSINFFDLERELWVVECNVGHVRRGNEFCRRIAGSVGSDIAWSVKTDLMFSNVIVKNKYNLTNNH